MLRSGLTSDGASMGAAFGSAEGVEAGDGTSADEAGGGGGGTGCATDTIVSEDDSEGSLPTAISGARTSAVTTSPCRTMIRGTV